MKQPRLLHLHLRRQYFTAIREGTKDEEYRRFETWAPKLIEQDYDGIVLYDGYPRREEGNRRMERVWRGWRVTTVTHPEFGPEPVKVFAIRVNPERPLRKTKRSPEIEPSRMIRESRNRHYE